MKLRRVILKLAEPLIVFTLWLLVFIAPILIFQNDDQVVWSDVNRSWLGVLPFLLLFLVNHLLLTPFLFFRNNRALYFIAAFSLVVAFSFSSYLSDKGNRDPRSKPMPRMHQSPPPQFENQPLPGNPPDQDQRNRTPIPFPPFVNTFLIAVLIVGFDTGLRMIFRWSKLEQEKTVLEKENVKNQLAFHALIDIDTEEAKDSIIKLSKLMRHLLYDSQAEKTTLQKEVEFINSYLNLMKLRYSDKVDIKVDLPDSLPETQIPPLLFTSLIENAFKHGISYNTFSFIHHKMEIVDSRLYFQLANSKNASKQGESQKGIGLENTHKRLQLLYADNYSLTLTDTEKSFTVNLEIPL